MRITFFLSTILLLNFFGSHAQSFKNKNYLDFSAGPSFPIGEYAETDITNSFSGFANTGQLLKISYTHVVNNNFGLSVALHGQRNPIDTKAFETSLSQTSFYYGPFIGSTPYPNPTQVPSHRYGNWKFEKSSWLFGSLLAGGHGQLHPQQSKKILFTAKAMLGPVYAHAPELNGKSTSDTAAATIKQSSSSAFGIAYIINGGIQLKLTSRTHLLVQAEYLGTNKILFKDIETTSTSTHYSNGFPISQSMQQSTVNGKQKINSVNLNLGLGISL